MEIRMQRIGDNIFPTDAVSRERLKKASIAVKDLDIISPRFVKQGYRLRIENY